MARIKKAQVGKKLTVKRTREVADSLESAGYKKIASSALSKIASKDTRDSLSKSGWKDVDNANRYKKLASKAEGKSMRSGGKTPAWTRSEGKDPKGGLNRKGIASYRRENPGSKLSMAVTTPPSKLKKGSKAAKRRKSFCARMSGVKGPMRKPNGKPTRKALALRKWNC